VLSYYLQYNVVTYIKATRVHIKLADHE